LAIDARQTFTAAFTRFAIRTDVTTVTFFAIFTVGTQFAFHTIAAFATIFGKITIKTKFTIFTQITISACFTFAQTFRIPTINTKNAILARIAAITQIAIFARFITHFNYLISPTGQTI
jgi:hypothetical protein